MRLQAYVRFGRDALRSGGLAPAVRALSRKTWSSSDALGLGRDLRRPHTAPRAAVPITVRPMTPADAPAILEAGTTLTPEENWDRRSRRLLLESGIGRPYVAVTADNEPCYVQWLFGEADNHDVHRFFAGIFPTLRPGQALLEGAFTPTVHRGKKIMSEAMSLIAERAEDLDAHHVLTFVGTDNPASLKGCARAGFTDEIARRIDTRLGHRRVDFTALPARANAATGEKARASAATGEKDGAAVPAPRAAAPVGERTRETAGSAARA